MDLHVRPFTLTLSEPFVISRSADEEAEVVQVAIAHDGVVGYGEAAPDPHYGESVPGAIEFCERAAADLGDDPFAIEAVLGRVASRGDQMAAAARSTRRCTTWSASSAASRCGGSSGSTGTIPPTSYTISIDTVEGTADRARRAAGYHALKIKVGGPDDLERVRVVRGEAPDALIRVDANEAWTVEFDARHLPGAGRAQRRADRAAAAAVRRRRRTRSCTRMQPADPDRARRELPHAARRRGGVAGAATASTSS